jgi:hypothetical protein
MWSITHLSDLRAAVKEALEAGLPTVAVMDYTLARFVPPVAIVVPDEPFMVPGEQFGAWNIRLKVLLINRTATDVVAANEQDDLVFQALHALDDFDVLEVSAPQEVTLRQGGRDTTYWGSVITLDFNTAISKEA